MAELTATIHTFGALIDTASSKQAFMLGVGLVLDVVAGLLQQINILDLQELSINVAVQRRRANHLLGSIELLFLGSANHGVWGPAVLFEVFCEVSDEVSGLDELERSVASPPVLYPCFYGINTPEQKELSAVFSSVEEVRRNIDADSLAFISLNGLKSSTTGIHCGHCSSCFDGEFPAGVPEKQKDLIHRIQR